MSYKYAILGTGALGGFYGAKLQHAGCEVHFLLRSDYEHVRQKGLQVRSVDGDFDLPQVNAYNDPAAMPSCDVVIVSLKTTQNHLLPQLIPPVLKPDGFVLVLQNGLGVEEKVAAIAGSDRVMGGLCFLCSNKVGAGQIHHLDYGTITLADYAPDYQPCSVTERMNRVASDLQTAGIPILLKSDLLYARWQKLIWNIPFNGLSVLLNARTDEMMASPSIREVIVSLMEEVRLGAATCDRRIAPDFIAKIMDVTDKMKPYRTSMKIDYDERRPLEIAAIFGAPLRAASDRGVHLPRIAMLYQQLQFLDQRNQRIVWDEVKE